MNAIEIQDVWQAIRESERSDETQFRDDELLIKAAATRLTQQPDQPGAMVSASITGAAINPNDSLQADSRFASRRRTLSHGGDLDQA